jgi:CubicO group peptidase (beta-lactamase class C family)
MRIQGSCAALVLAGIVGYASAQEVDSKTSISERMPAWLKQYKVPAAGVAVIKDGKVQWSAVFGERTTGIAASRDTVFNVASLTKPVFAMMALHIVARGDFDLDSGVSKYWIDPDVANDDRHHKLTPRIILSHQTGFPNWRRDQKLAFGFDPGTKYQYSGEGFEYLKAAIEKKEGRRLPELAKAIVFEPSGMNSTWFTWNERAEKHFAVGYDRFGKAYSIPKRTDPSAADDLLTTIDDYARFVAWVLNGAGLPERLFREMQRKQVKGQDGFNFGLGWQLIAAETRVLTHGGSDEGVRTETFLIPARKEAVVVLTNSDTSDPLIRLILEGTLGAATQNAIDLATWRMLEQLPPEELAQGAAKLSELPAVMDKFLHAIHAKFVSTSSLSPEEKAEAKNTFRQFVKGMVSGTVSKERVDAIAGRVLTPSGKGVRVKNLDEDDLRAIIKAAEAGAN